MDSERKTVGQRIFWFGLFWLLGVGVVGMVAIAIKLVLGA
ncbi:hypothetical protein QO005_003420 [Rhizobium paknamense]|uniref:DUF2474 domain-containing protein n=1 Tax=Rhizobium paknamense TaxID=1206817 RepID=A0ABU0IHG7_9HYPH|nr:hypothetical protein [Rhizobium paknamense]